MKSLSCVVALGLSTIASTTLAVDSSTEPAIRRSAETRFQNFSANMLSGTWHGVLRMRGPLPVASDTGLPDETPVELLIQHTGRNLRVLLRQQEEWIEAMPGGFQAFPAYSNLILVGVQSEGHPTPRWVESWTLQLAALNDDCALVEWTRAVTNVPASSSKTPAFTYAASGTMCRAGSMP